MARPKQPVIEYRSYELPPDFPLIALTGDQWHISPVPSKRLHFHNCLEIGVCHSESGTMVLGSEQRAFRSGFVTCIARNVPHTTWSSPGEHSLWSYLYVDPEALIGRSGLAVMPDLNEFNRLIASCCLLLSPEEHPWAMLMVKEILWECEHQAEGYRVCARGLFVALILRLLRIFSKDTKHKAEKNLTILAPALDYIYAHYNQTFPLETLADVCHMSPANFRLLFHAQLGTNPLNFLHQMRILKSCTYLRTSKRSVSDVAAQVGYASLSCFNQHFQRVMGCTPSVWRRSGAPVRPSLVQRSGWLEAEEPEDAAVNPSGKEQHHVPQEI